VRFVGEVQEEGTPAAFAPELARRPEQAVLALPNKPSTAVLPFVNLSGDPEQEYFADGMSRRSSPPLPASLTVRARAQFELYVQRPGDRSEAGRARARRAGCPRSSVRRGGNRVRIAAQLIETETGAHLWADRFDGSLEDVFDLQDKVAPSVAGGHRAGIADGRDRPFSKPPD
jgi:TolB-like protein